MPTSGFVHAGCGLNPRVLFKARNPDVHALNSIHPCLSADIDVERSRLYLDLILISLAQNAPAAFEATINSLGYEYQSDFARRYYGQGKAEGRIELILKLLAFRFGTLTVAVQARVRSAQDAQLDAVAERMLTAKTLDEAVSPLS